MRLYNDRDTKLTLVRVLTQEVLSHPIATSKNGVFVLTSSWSKACGLISLLNHHFEVGMGDIVAGAVVDYSLSLPATVTAENSPGAYLFAHVVSKLDSPKSYIVEIINTIDKKKWSSIFVESTGFANNQRDFGKENKVSIIFDTEGRNIKFVNSKATWFDDIVDEVKKLNTGIVDENDHAYVNTMSEKLCERHGIYWLWDV